MDWKGKKVLVTGAGGFIGSHLVEKLVNLGADTRAFVRYNSRNNYGSLELLPEYIKCKIDVLAGDLRNFESVRMAVKGVQIVFHLGASIAIPYSFINPHDVVETNVIGTLNILSAIKEYEVEKMIQTSTSEVYGSAIYSPMDEKHPLQAQSPYAASKIGADKLAESFYLFCKLPIAIIRPFNTYGPRQSARAVIPTIIIQALSFNKVSIGSFYPIRDFTYVDDTVDGFIKVAESPNTIGEVVNIGSGNEISIGDLANKIVSLIGKKVEIVSETSRTRPYKSEVIRLIADRTKAKNMVGWEPKISLDDGLNKTIKWISENLYIYKANIYNV